MGSSPTRVDIFGFFTFILHIVALRQQKVVNYLLNCPVQGSLLFVTYIIIQGIIGSEMLIRTGPLNGKCKK